MDTPITQDIERDSRGVIPKPSQKPKIKELDFSYQALKHNIFFIPKIRRK